MSTPVFMACDSANVDSTTQQCTAPYWVVEPSLLPSITAADGVEIGVAILALWGVAYMARALRMGGD